MPGDVEELLENAVIHSTPETIWQKARPLARLVFNFDNNDLALTREDILEFWIKISGFSPSLPPAPHELWTMIEKEEASLDDFDVEEPVPEEAEDGQLDEDARICSLKFSATTDLA